MIRLVQPGISPLISPDTAYGQKRHQASPLFTTTDNGASVRFAAQNKNPNTQDLTLHQETLRLPRPIRRFIAKTIRLLNRFSEWLERNWFHLKKFFAPVSPPKLQAGIAPLLKQSSTGFPIALIRAGMIQNKDPSAFIDYKNLQEQFDPRKVNIPELLEKQIHSEASAYLATHLIALENAMKNPGKPLYLNMEEQPKAIRLGVQDANAVLFHRTQELFYSKEKKPLADSLYQLISAIPKVALHEHHSGGPPTGLVRARFLENNHPKSYLDSESLQDYLRTDRPFTEEGEGPLYKPDLNRYLWKNDNYVRPSVETPAASYLAAYLFALRQGMENVRYLEYRFNPFSRDAKDPLKFAQPIQQGLEDAKQFLWETRRQKIDYNLIFCASRHPRSALTIQNHNGKQEKQQVVHALEVLEAAIEARKHGIKVTGFDIVGDETGYAISDFKPVADALHQYNNERVKNGKPELCIGATIHSGETPKSGLISHPDKPLSGLESISQTIDLFWDQNTPLRIGHGIQLLPDARLIQRCLEGGISLDQALNLIPEGQAVKALVEKCQSRNVGFEQCPKSNVQTGAISFYEDLPSLVMSRYLGLPVSISCDNRTTSKTNSCNELVKLTRYLGAHHADRKKFQLDGMKTAFVFDSKLKAEIQQDMISAFKQIERNPVHRKVIKAEQDPEKFQAMLDNQNV